MKIESLPNYQNLDLSGEAQQAAARMEARARAPASQDMFQYLIAPLLTPAVKKVLEFGCGTAALSRRIAQAAGQAQVFASDKSTGMLQAARHHLQAEDLQNLQLQQWDALDETSFPFPTQTFDLIISSMVVPYFDEAQTVALVERLAARLSVGGVLAFMDQDWGSDTLYYPRVDLLRTILNKVGREPNRILGLGLRSVMRQAGLQVLPRCSFLWTDDAYGPYTRDLLERFGDAASDQGRIPPQDRDEWKRTLDDLAQEGNFYYGIVYHLVAGKRGFYL